MLEAPDAAALARFYAELLGWEAVKEDAADAAVAPPEGVAYVAFQSSADYVPPVWPAAGQMQQMMMHLDFEVSDLAVATAHAVELGGQEARHQPQPNLRVMLDPAGHPFCLYLDTALPRR